MKAVRIVAILAAFALAMAMPLVAQEGQGGSGGQGQGQRRGPMSPEDQLKRMTEEYTLTQDQQDKIKPILQDQQKQMQELFANGKSREENRDAMMKLRTDTNDKIKAVLNDEQKKKFDERSQQRGGGGQRPPSN